MSNALAIAAVSNVLKDLLNEGLIDNEYAEGVKVTAGPPVANPSVGSGAQAQLNLFLYAVTPNQGWRNVGLPARDADGQPVGNPPLALDLHYLVTAYDQRDLHAEALLGYAMQLLHEHPVLSRKSIRTSLARDLNATGLPTSLRRLAEVGLADQLESIRITLHPLGYEEMSKLWTAFHAPYRLSVAYLVTVVLIESTRAARSAPPVLTRGKPVPDPGGGRDREAGVAVFPGLVVPVPTLEELRVPQRAGIRLGETLTVRGHHLAGTAVRARFRLARGERLLELPAPAEATATGFELPLPPDPPPGPPAPPPAADSPLNPDNWQVGLYEVNVVLEQGGEERTTNRLPLLLAPRIAIERSPAAGPLVSLTVTCSPRVLAGQTVALLVGERELKPEAFTAPTGSLLFLNPPAPNRLPAGTLPVRLRVDGIESLVVDRQADPPRFAQTVEVS